MKKSNLQYLLLSIGICIVFAIIGGLLAGNSLENWFAEIKHPWFSLPPGFGAQDGKGCYIKKVVRPDAKRKAFEYLDKKYKSSKRMKCRVLGLTRSTQRRKLQKPDDSEVEQAILKILKNKEHRGIDWVYMKLRNDGYTWNRKKVIAGVSETEVDTEAEKQEAYTPQAKITIDTARKSKYYMEYGFHE